MSRKRLSPDEINARREKLPTWIQEGDVIKRSFEFDSFLEAIFFINRIAPLAEARDHHPELFNVYNRVDIVLTTHDADGLTEKDFDLAAAIDSVA